jgi:sulfur-carrier protein adenylyltransferase/sulfurtransferase
MEGQEKLKSAKVLVIGCGGLGCPVLQYLAAAGVGFPGIIDYDLVDMSNLQRQILFSTEDTGKPKVSVAKDKLEKYNPYIKIIAFNEKLGVSNALDILNQFAIIVDCTDNFSTRYLVNDACVILNKPLVSGSIYKFEGQVTVFNYLNGPTYRCLYPNSPQQEIVANCNETGVLGTLTGLTGTLMANEVIKIVTGMGNVLSGKLLTFDLLSTRFQTFEYKPDPKNREINKLSDDYNMTYDDEIKEITPQELKEKLSRNEPLQIIDVREPEEYLERNIGGVLIPLRELEKNMDKIKKDIPAILVCRSGVRSMHAAKILQRNNYNKLYNLKGGLIEY